MNSSSLFHALAVLSCVCSVALTPEAKAVESVISFNLNGNASNNNRLVETESAGLRPAPFWNNLQAFDSFLSSIRDDSGSVVVGVTASAHVGGGRLESNASSPDARLMGSGFELRSNSPTFIVQNLPASFTSRGYDLYLYVRNAGRLRILQGNSSTAPVLASYDLIASSAFAEAFVDATTSGTGNYVVLRDLTTASFSVDSPNGTLQGNGIYLLGAQVTVDLARPAIPVLSLASGTYEDRATINATVSTPGATMRYTTDGSPPTGASTLLAGPVVLTQSTTLCVRAFSSDGYPGLTATATYTIRCAAPAFSPDPWTYPAQQTISLSSITPGAIVRYTTDGSEPSPTLGVIYDGTQISLDAPLTLKAVAYKPGLVPSTITSGQYVVGNQTLAPPSFYHPSGEAWTHGVTALITAPVEGAQIRYTLDGTTPTRTYGKLFTNQAESGEWPANTLGLVLTRTTTLKALAFKSGLIDSPIAEATYPLLPGASSGTLLTTGTATYFDGTSAPFNIPASVAFDRDARTHADVSMTNQPVIIGRAGVRAVPTAVRILTITRPGPTFARFVPGSVSVIARDEGQAWTTLAVLPGLPNISRDHQGPNQWTEYPITATRAYDDIALRYEGSLNPPPFPTRNQTAEIEFFGTAAPEPAPPPAPTRPMLTDGEPAPGKFVKQYDDRFPGSELFHGVYLPTNWEPGRTYPVIVEYTPNIYYPNCLLTGRVEDARLGHGFSGGKDFIWVVMPINENTTPRHLVWLWSNQESIAEYTLTNLRKICDLYGGDPSAVFVTGLSRGSIATSYVGLSNPNIADVWAGFIMNSVWDNDPVFSGAGYLTRLARVQGRPVFIVYGSTEWNPIDGTVEPDDMAAILRGNGTPVTQFENLGWGHCYQWAEQYTDPGRQAVRSWLADTLATRPGTRQLTGRVVDAEGNGLPGVLVQCGSWHRATTDADGRYTIRGLIPGTRTLTLSKAGHAFTPGPQTMVHAHADIAAATQVGITRAAAPVIHPAPGSFATAQTITLASSTPDTIIYYTTDGTSPEPSTSPRYTAPFVLETDTTVNAIATRSGIAASPIATASYLIRILTPRVPANFIATPRSIRRVDLSWTDAATDETSYLLEARSSESSLWTTLASLPANAASYTDLDLLPGSTRFYRLQALNESGSSDAIQASATTFSEDIDYTLFGSAPATGDTYSDNHYELGMRFRTSASGRLLTLRVWHPAGGPSTYALRLWRVTGSQSGEVLANLTVPATTANAWIEGALSAPISLDPNETYVVSYAVAAGQNYLSQPGGLSSSRMSGPLMAPAAGGNGVFAVGAQRSFPSQSYNGSNYWLDVGFQMDLPYADWAHARGLSHDSAVPAADPDADGLANLVEYALGSLPRLANPSEKPAAKQEEGHLTLTYTQSKNATGITVRAEVSSDLVNWSSAPTDVQQQWQRLDGTTHLTTTARDLTASPPAVMRFMRLRVTTP